MPATITWIHVGPTVMSAFLASIVEFVEALTIVLAVGTVRGWPSAFLGTSAGLAVLTALVVILGPALGLIPITLLQLIIGLLLLLFGLSWLRKAVLRAAGMIPLHDEGKVFEDATASLRGAGGAPTLIRWDSIAIVTTFKAVVLEGLEVVFIVLAVGSAAHMIIPASLGAAAAGLAVGLVGVVLHRPLARVPENTLKLSVGVLIASFGCFGWAKASASTGRGQTSRSLGSQAVSSPSHYSRFESCGGAAWNAPTSRLGGCICHPKPGHDRARYENASRREVREPGVPARDPRRQSELRCRGGRTTIAPPSSFAT